MPPAKKKDDEDTTTHDEGMDDAPLDPRIVRLVNNTATGAANQHSKRQAESLRAEMASMRTEFAELKGLLQKLNDSPIIEADSKKPPQPDPQVIAMTKKVDELSRQLKERDDKLIKEESTRKGVMVDQALSSALTALGVDPNRMRGALLVHKGQAFVDDTGAVKYKVKRDGYDEDLDPQTALKEWAANDEGKAYIAATGTTGGSGTRAPRAAGGSGKTANPAAAKTEKMQEARGVLQQWAQQVAGAGGVDIE